MAIMPNDFWSGWIIVITVTSLLGLAWLVLSIYLLRSGDDQLHEEPVWDENLQEGNTPAPLWWFWLILAMMVFSVVYLMLYPGLGSFQGAFQWSQGGQLAERQASYNAEFEPLEQQIVSSSYEALGNNELAMNTAAGIFEEHCSACHGIDARGQAGLFPSLSDGVWQWGGMPAQIEQSIRNGRNAAMVGWLSALGGEGQLQNVAEFVLSMSDGIDAAHPGKRYYDRFCIACHGPNGDGNPVLGAPRLNDDVWLYGDEIGSVRTTIIEGRMGQMPAFAETLDDQQIKLLTAWLLARNSAD
ncbi:MAG: cytochrome-c oxidase, cbb3-type subunit III [Gammaproteobacteria bacterium]|nr:cytochrome-c oxidase, cbb3-type subunit III [Gammaproteobacteria bacterium]|tara:strand:+ start:1540 stop:2436 length:897 start_codon:yes stop_codon:yes gene_type:complete